MLSPLFRLVLWMLTVGFLTFLLLSSFVAFSGL